MKEQLYKKENGEYYKIFPLNYIQNLIDSESGNTLISILSSFNNIALPYQGNVKDTRELIPNNLRRKGLWITYNNGEEFVTEYYKGTAEDIQDYWAEDYNWEIVPNLEYVQSEASKLPNGIITPDKLSPALQELIKQNNNITNLPDDEDIEERNSVLSFKDRKYNPNTASGKGYKILRKNWTKIGSKTINLLTQEMINEPNTIYEIRYDFDLNEEEITIPEKSTLKFNGGSFKKGIIKGNYTEILWNNNGYIFDEISISGTWKVRKISTLMFRDLSAINSLINVFNLTDENYINDVQIEKNNYDYIFENTKNEQHCIDIKSNTNVSILGIIRLKENDFTHYHILSISNVENVNITGNGYIYGDKPLHTGSTGEWGHCIAIYNSINVYINGINIYDAWGDCITIASITEERESSNITIDSCNLNNGRRQGISIIRANNVIINNCIISNIKGTDPQAAIDYEPNAEQEQYNCIIENCIIDNCTQGITGYAPDSSIAENYIIRNCKLTNIMYNAIASAGIKNVDISNCKVDISEYGTKNAVSLNNGYISIKNTTINAKNSITGIFQMNNDKLIVSECDIKCNNYCIRAANNIYLDKNTFTGKEFFYINAASANNSIISNNIINGSIIINGSQFKFYNNDVTIGEGQNLNKFNKSTEYNSNYIYNNVFRYNGNTIIDSVLSINGENNIIENNIIYTGDKTKYGLLNNSINSIINNNLVIGSINGGRRIGPATEGTYIKSNNKKNFGSIENMPMFPSELNDSVIGFGYYCTDNNAPMYHKSNGRWYNAIGKSIQNTFKELFIITFPNEVCKITFPMFTGCLKLKIGSHYNYTSNNYYSIYSFIFRNYNDDKKCIKSHVEVFNPNANSESIDLNDYKYKAVYASFPILNKNEDTVSIYIKGYDTYNITSILEFSFDGILNINDEIKYPSYKIVSENININDMPEEVEFRDVFICPSHGSTSNINELLFPYKGCVVYNDTINKTVFGNNVEWVDGNNIKINIITKGTTSQRPTLTSTDEGFEYYDSTLKKKILWNGTAWVNLDGTVLE